MAFSKFGPALAASVSVVCVGAPAQAQMREFDIPAGNLKQVLEQYVRETRQQILYRISDVRAKHSPGVRGSMTDEAALRALLVGTGYEVQADPSGAFAIGRAGNGRSAGYGPTSATTPSPDAYSGEGEIIVTATKRDTRLQDTPAAISAFSTESLDRSVIRNATDIAAYTPGLTASTNLGGTYSIRGISSDLLSISADSSVATYVDGVYFSRQTSNQIPFADVERVEVLRGPQGTIYGRNATGGVISFVTKAPSREFEGSANAEIGNLEHFQGGLALSGPLVEDKILFRMSAEASKRDGYVRNVGPGGGKGNDEDYQSFRGKLQFNLAETLKLTLAGDYFRQRQGFPIDQLLALGGAGAGALPPAGKFEAVINGDVVDTFDNRDLYGASATIDWSANDAIAVKSITAYRDTKTAIFTDDDATTLFRSHSYIAERSKTFTQEVYANSTGHGRLDYLFGANFLSEKADQDLRDAADSGVTFFPADASSRAWAAYGEVGYALTDQLHIGAGARYSHEHRELSNSLDFDDGTGRVNLFTSTRRKGSWNSFTPSFTIDYKVSENTLLYTLATKGFKSGGFASLGLEEEGFSPETVWNYEGGIKTKQLDGALIFNLAAFYSDYRDLQRRVGNSLSTLRLVNAASARLYGVEVETTIKPIRAWTIYGNYAYLNAEYKDFQTAIPEAVDPITNPDGAVNLKGQPLERSPKHKFSVVSSYDIGLRDGAAIELTGSVTYQTKITFRSGRGALYEQPDFALFNAAVTYRPDSKNWSVQLYGSNLTNVEHFLNKEGGPTAEAAASGYSGLPRTYGVRVRLDF
ncbi:MULTISPECIES: TonB-dependent receptor domain-containing protein [unclassified Sphingomonas]|uniref:TonB-dependent receptor domain-containing protein n=1 Tax=unclassified Sphingomonas TaxID=196159 RepID=UPI0006F4CE54|nr:MULTISPECIES: TonB-dependent receptor [unclassified Sphingomonas]KQX26007.1 hypothetical protein ASD17_00605 [Sphingomonas sp. Root1294]KQY69073.1 hypothetical protein ASD39_01800 [Sphingomonas sp. Root50]KRB89327.1 hypothetical protein ASE22_16715 [Sphingomonas sp. Root720]